MSHQGASSTSVHDQGPQPTVAVIDSGHGLLPTAAWLHQLAPGVGQILCSDPLGSPWGSKEPMVVLDRVFALARRAIAEGADAIAVACNTGSVTARLPLREEFEPRIPIITTVPPVKPASLRCDRFAVWATPVTIESPYLHDLLEVFASGHDVTLVACPDLADAIEHADEARISAAVAAAAAQTPQDVRGVVLGCTHYPLAADMIASALPAGVVLFDSAEAVARQVLRRLGIEPVRDHAAHADDSAFAAVSLRGRALEAVPWARTLTLPADVGQISALG